MPRAVVPADTHPEPAGNGKRNTAASFGIRLTGDPLSHEKTVVGKYRIVVGYGADGRITVAESKGPRGYSARLQVQSRSQEGLWTNSYGDSSHWADGRERVDAVFGPFEQTYHAEIGFDDWLDKSIICMIGKNT